MSASSQSIGPCNPNIPTETLLAYHSVSSSEAVRTKAGTVLGFVPARLLGVTQLFYSVTTKSVSQSSQVFLTTPTTLTPPYPPATRRNFIKLGQRKPLYKH